MRLLLRLTCILRKHELESRRCLGGENMLRTTLVLATATAALFARPAHADPGPASEVYSPSVTRGMGELEVRSGLLRGSAVDGDWQTKVEAGYGLTD